MFAEHPRLFGLAIRLFGVDLCHQALLIELTACLFGFVARGGQLQPALFALQLSFLTFKIGHLRGRPRDIDATLGHVQQVRTLLAPAVLLQGEQGGTRAGNALVAGKCLQFLGAVDDVTKPFDSDELLARVRAALRQRRATQTSAAVVRVDDVEIDLDERSVRRSGVEVHLTPKEYGLLAALAAHPGRVITHGQLLRSVWGPAHEANTEYLRVTVRGLRGKLEADAAAPRLILNEPGVGYRLAK